MRIQRTRRTRAADAGRAADLRHRRHPLVGRLADLRQRPGVRAGDPLAARRQAPARRRTGCCRQELEAHVDLTRRRRQLLGRARRCCTRCSCWSTTPSATGCTPSTRTGRRGAVREGAAGQRGADGEDPHGRLDAGDHRPPDDRARRCARTGGACWASGFDKLLRPPHERRVIRGIPGSQKRPPRRARTR